MITAFAKKVVKNCGYAIAAAAIALSLSPAMAFAAPTSPTDVGNTMLTVNDLLAGDTVSAYLIADADIDATNNLTYTMAPGLPAAYDSIDEIAAIASDSAAFVQNSAMQNAASVIANSLSTPAVTVTATGTSAQLSLGSGYYLVRVTGTNGESRVYQSMIVDASPEASNGAYAPRTLTPIGVKKTEVAIEKGVGAAYDESTNEYSVGDSMPFRISTAVPSYPADARDATFVIGDIPTAGTEIDTASIQLNGAVAQSGADYTLTASPAGYRIEFTRAYVLAHPGAPIVVTYNAKLTSAAFSRGPDDLTGNTATVTFNPNPYSPATASLAGRAKVKTYGYVFKRVTPDGHPLAGAVFTVTLANGRQLTSTSDQNGYVYFEDLAAGTYTAVETTVPSGYRKAPDQTFNLSEAACIQDNPATAANVEDNYLVSTVDVTNPRMFALPMTGGAGIFLLSGLGVLLAVVGIALVLFTGEGSIRV